jgi:hypothetical protein
MKPRVPDPLFDQRRQPQEPTCVAHLWPQTLPDRRRDSDQAAPLTADFDAAAAVSLGHGCYRVHAVPMDS